MQFVKTVQLQGDADKYSLSPDIKRYTLIDLGFEETKRGNFEYVGSVDTDNPFKPVAKLRILISADLSGLKWKQLPETECGKLISLPTLVLRNLLSSIILF